MNGYRTLLQEFLLLIFFLGGIQQIKSQEVKTITPLPFDNAQLSKMVPGLNLTFIEGGTFNMGEVSENYSIQEEDSFLMAFHPGLSRVTVSSYYIGAKEVTNLQYRRFYEAKVKEVGAEQAARYLPDTNVWVREYSKAYNEPMAKHYFSHPAYDNYPVVGVSWEQAQEYCLWLSEEVNRQLEEAGEDWRIPNFRLPTEAEWEFAAKAMIGLKTYSKDGSGVEQKLYPWGEKLMFYENMKKYRVNKKLPLTPYQANFGPMYDQNKVALKTFSDDNFMYTAPVGSFIANDYGLKDMAGNVSEWVQDMVFIGPKPARRVYGQDTVQHDSSTFIMPSDSSWLEKRPEWLAKATVIEQMSDEELSQKARTYLTERFDHWTEEKLAANSEKLVRDLRNFSKLNPEQAPLRYVKGGSWRDGPIYLQAGAKQAFPQSKASSRIGFRVAMTRISGPIPR